MDFARKHMHEQTKRTWLGLIIEFLDTEENHSFNDYTLKERTKLKSFAGCLLSYLIICSTCGLSVYSALTSFK